MLVNQQRDAMVVGKAMMPSGFFPNWHQAKCRPSQNKRPRCPYYTHNGSPHDAVVSSSTGPYTLLPARWSCHQVTSWRRYLGMNEPIFLGVNPWFLIFLSKERNATIDCAEHPGLENTNRLTSLISLTSLAVFWEFFPRVGGDINSIMTFFPYQRNRGFPNRAWMERDFNNHPLGSIGRHGRHSFSQPN